MLPVVILAGGLATRLRPITETIPKSMVEVAGKPFLLHQLDYLRRQGVRRVVLCTGYLGEQIESVIGDGADLGLEIRYSPDGPTLLGTGGAISQALPLAGDHFFVLYGDSFLPISFAPVQQHFLASGKPALMTVMENGGRWDTSNVVFRDGELVEYNKSAPRSEMSFIDYGLGVLSASIFASYPQGKAFDLAEVYHDLSMARQLAGYQVHERFYEIGSHGGLREAEEYFLTRG